VLAKLRDAVAAALKAPDMIAYPRARFGAGFAFGRIRGFMEGERKKMGGVVRISGAKAD